MCIIFLKILFVSESSSRHFINSALCWIARHYTLGFCTLWSIVFMSLSFHVVHSLLHHLFLYNKITCRVLSIHHWPGIRTVLFPVLRHPCQGALSVHRCMCWYDFIWLDHVTRLHPKSISQTAFTFRYRWNMARSWFRNRCNCGIAKTKNITS